MAGDERGLVLNRWKVPVSALSRSVVVRKKRLWVVVLLVVFRTPSMGLSSGE